MIYIGLDISKATLDVCIIDADTISHQTIDNTATAHQALINQLEQKNKERIHACCEYTGIYYQQIAKAFYDANIKISVVNAYSIKSYARLTLSRTKTDKKDAQLIADYCKVNQPSLWTPPSKHSEALKSITRRIEQLTKLRTMELNRQKVADSYTVQSIQQTIDFLTDQLKIVREQLQQTINNCARLKHQQKLLTSIVGVGDYTAAILLSVLVEIERFPTPRHLVSYLGLSPITIQSGTSVRGKSKISKMGDKFIRKSLYLPARTACLRSKLFKDWTQAQIERGKHPNQVYIIMMRKIVIYAYTVIKHNQPFDPSTIKKSSL